MIGAPPSAFEAEMRENDEKTMLQCEIAASKSINSRRSLTPGRTRSDDRGSQSALNLSFPRLGCDAPSCRRATDARQRIGARNGGSALSGSTGRNTDEKEPVSGRGACRARHCRAGFGRTEVQAGRGCQVHLVEFRGPQEGRPQGRDPVDLRSVARRGRGAGPLGARIFHRGDRRRRSTTPRPRTTSSRSSSTRRPAARRTSPILPQPGLIQDLASKGLLTPLDDADAQFVKDNYGAGQSWVDLGTYKDKDGTPKFFAFPYKADLKSLVWYVPENFEEAGYEVPKTWEDMMKLSDQIVADGGVPWCIGLGSGGATGWPATDWVEDIMLRTAVARDLRQVDQERDPVQRSGRRQRAADLRRHRHQRQDGRWRQGRGCRDRLPRQPEGSLRRSAQVLHASPGVVHLVLLPGRHDARRGRRLLLPAADGVQARTRQSGARRRHACS